MVRVCLTTAAGAIRPLWLAGIDVYKRQGFGVHGGLPQLVGVHLAQTLEAADLHLGVGVVPPHLGGHRVPFLVGVGHLYLIHI